MSFIPINKPILGEEERRAVEDVLSSGLLTDASYEGGKYVREFERKMEMLLGAKHVVATNSGTAALHCALLALGVGPGDEVIVPSFTFVATANVVLASGARPVFVDTRKDYNMDPAAFRKAVTKKTKVVIPVHLYGYPADMDEINETASKHGISVIEDAAESLGATYKGRQTGTMSSAGCFSMYATKVATSGEGGAISTRDDGLADTLRLVRNHGMVHGYDTKLLGLNYRLPELGAAVASAQLDKLDSFLRARARNVSSLQESFRGLKGSEFTQTEADRRHVYYLYTLRLRKNRDLVLSALRDAGVGAAVYFKLPVHKTPLYVKLGHSKRKLPVTESDAGHVLSLPVHPGVTPADLQRVAGAYAGAVRKFL